MEDAGAPTPPTHTHTPLILSSITAGQTLTFPLLPIIMSMDPRPQHTHTPRSSLRAHSRGVFVKVGAPRGRAVSLERSQGGRDKKNLVDEQQCVLSPFSLSSIPSHPSSLIPKLLVDLCAIASRLYALTFPASGGGGGGPLCWERQINLKSLSVGAAEDDNTSRHRCNLCPQSPSTHAHVRFHYSHKWRLNYSSLIKMHYEQ